MVTPGDPPGPRGTGTPTAGRERIVSHPIVYIDRSIIRPGKLDETKRAVSELVEFIESREPQLASYGFHFDEETSRMTVVAVHPDAASVELHMDVGGAAFRRFADLIDLEAIEVYGELSDRATGQLRQKADALGSDGRVIVQPLHAGFSRLSGATATPPKTPPRTPPRA